MNTSSSSSESYVSTVQNIICTKCNKVFTEDSTIMNGKILKKLKKLNPSMSTMCRIEMEEVHKHLQQQKKNPMNNEENSQKRKNYSSSSSSSESRSLTTGPACKKQQLINPLSNQSVAYLILPTNEIHQPPVETNDIQPISVYIAPTIGIRIPPKSKDLPLLRRLNGG